jgi:DnaJ-class molecular chaperone
VEADIMRAEAIRKQEGINTVNCAFCQGKGIDPFELLSKFSTCQVCNGHGEVTISKPAIECVFCGGMGIHPHQRLTCVVCGGRGMVGIKEPVETCPDCKGQGIIQGDYLPCLKCNGTGVVNRK